MNHPRPQTERALRDVSAGSLPARGAAFGAFGPINAIYADKSDMKNEDFELGKEFYTATGTWLCTDIGTRVIVAIQLNQENPLNHNGPPYSIPEVYFDEYDMEGWSLFKV